MVMPRPFRARHESRHITRFIDCDHPWSLLYPAAVKPGTLSRHQHQNDLPWPDFHLCDHPWSLRHPAISARAAASASCARTAIPGLTFNNSRFDW